MIGLFPDSYNEIELTQKALYELVLSPLDLTKTLIRKAGHSEHPEYSDDKAFKEGLLRVQVDFKKAADLINHNLRRSCPQPPESPANTGFHH